jgi:outer membrane protein
MPSSEQMAVQTALSSNPDISAAAKAVNAARERTRSTIGSRLPRLGAFATGEYTNFLGAATNIFNVPEQQVHKTAQFGLTMTLPLYEGGAEIARIRDARAQEQEAIEGARDTSGNVVSLVRSEYSQFTSLSSEQEVAQDQISTAEEAYRGVEMLNRLGDRNSQDVLNADQLVLLARSQAIQIDADRYVAAVTLLGRMGILAGADDTGWLLCGGASRASSAVACRQ